MYVGRRSGDTSDRSSSESQVEGAEPVRRRQSDAPAPSGPPSQQPTGSGRLGGDVSRAPGGGKQASQPPLGTNLLVDDKGGGRVGARAWQAGGGKGYHLPSAARLTISM